MCCLCRRRGVDLGCGRGMRCHQNKRVDQCTGSSSMSEATVQVQKLVAVVLLSMC